MRHAVPIRLTPAEKVQLSRWARGRSTPRRLTQRAQLILRAAAGEQNQDIAARLGVSRPTVARWRKRFAKARLAGILQDAARSGRRPDLSVRNVRAVLRATLEKTASQEQPWSTRSMAEAQGMSRMAVQRIWKTYDLRPRRLAPLGPYPDLRLSGKRIDTLGLYFHPPDWALALAVTPRRQARAARGTRTPARPGPGSPARPPPAASTSSVPRLLGALRLLERTTRARSGAHHRDRILLDFLKTLHSACGTKGEVHLILDNYCTHHHASIYDWLRRNTGLRLHFIPKSESRLVLMTRCLRELTPKRIRPGSFERTPELEAAIRKFAATDRTDRRSFVWSSAR